MSIQRFKLKTGARAKQITLPVGITATSLGLSPQPFEDWDLSDDGGLDDLKESLEFLDWEYVEPSPTSPRAVVAPEWQSRVIDRDLTAPPGSPGDGDRYIVASVGTGAWAGHDLEIAQWRASPAQWLFTVPTEGMAIWVNDENKLLCHNGTAWFDPDPIFARSSNSTLTGSSVGSDTLINAMQITAVANPSSDTECLPGTYTVSFCGDLEVPSGSAAQIVLYAAGAPISNSRLTHDGPGAVRWSANVISREATVALAETLEARVQTVGGSVTLRTRRLTAFRE